MKRAWFRLALQVLALLLLQVHQHAMARATVGRVALSVGDATRISAEGQTEPLRLGMPLSTGDRIITSKDAIALLVFVDEGRVSLRADSELVIRRYQIDPSGAETQMHLELVRGAARQISGQGAKAQPERYRLSTPIAAIGVRGTDFLAKSGGDALETFIQEGVIVVMQNGSECQFAGARTTCGTPLALLSSLDARQYLRLSASGQMDRRAVGADELEGIFGISSANGVSLNKTGRVVAESVASKAAPGAEIVAVKTAAPPRPEAVAVIPVAASESWVGQGKMAEYNQLVSSSRTKPGDVVATEPTAPAQAQPPVQSQSLPDPVVVELPRQLVWGRFTSAADLPLTLSVAYDEARQGRHVTVGALGRYALWRDNPSGQLDRGLSGQVQFGLAAGEAMFEQAGQVSAAQLQRPTLAVNFDRSTFTASANLFHASVGSTDLSVAGKVNDEGLFVGSAPGQRVAGALSRDGREAGYLFARDVQLGTFSGITLWKAK